MTDKTLPPVLDPSPSLPDRDDLVKNHADPIHMVMNQVYSDFFTCFDLLPLSVFEEAGGFAPGLRVVHSPGAIMIFADFPGMEADEIDIFLLPGQLVISIEKNTVSRRGFPLFQSFRRKVAIPFFVDHREIKATFKKGALMVFLPEKKGTAAKNMRIPIDKA